MTTEQARKAMKQLGVIVASEQEFDNGIVFVEYPPRTIGLKFVYTFVVDSNKCLLQEYREPNPIPTHIQTLDFSD